jgi:hypothetical protein
MYLLKLPFEGTSFSAIQKTFVPRFYGLISPALTNLAPVRNFPIFPLETKPACAQRCILVLAETPSFFFLPRSRASGIRRGRRIILFSYQNNEICNSYDANALQLDKRIEFAYTCADKY